ncbi:glycosyltransferase family 2 protein [Candidatus Woesearchaeota archaeon]|nr:glycosyltransferase family 2 protein [Candidatus Woesearchaeota archaeon]
MKSKLSIIIPCYNEELGIPNLKSHLDPILKDLSKNYFLELIFVDDGSKDKTLELLKDNFDSSKKAKYEVKLIKHEVNQNLGAAMRTGFANATGDFVITMDSDCTYDPQTIPEMLKLLDTDTDMVIASPYHPQGEVRNVPKYRLLLSGAITSIYRLLTGSKIYTYTALFRAYKVKVVKEVSFNSNDFLATAEMLINALNKGYKVKEYPTVLNVRQFGESKIRLARVIKSHFKYASSLLFLKLFKAKNKAAI